MNPVPAASQGGPPEDPVILEVDDLTVELPLGYRRKVHAVSGVSFSLRQNETLGLVGESGCGKSTLGKTIVGLVKPSRGSVTIAGRSITSLKGRELRLARRNAQLVFQDPLSSLNPRRTVLNSLIEPMAVWNTLEPDQRAPRAMELLEEVGLDPSLIKGRFPSQLSGGQCQRVSIARALCVSPTLLICDEPVSALDVSIQAQILNLLHDIREQRKLAMLFISHDLSVVHNISDKIAVMYMGRLCETGQTAAVYKQPLHPYTSLLLDSIPGTQLDEPQSGESGESEASGPDPATTTQPLEPPSDVSSAINPPSGCRYHPRCPYADATCESEQPPMRELRSGHFVGCHHPLA
ncbi:MAG: ABC transporter ATP-binding protein [Actinobacteria bacterium]|nr:ABC transporter ATP-binding protein [Actinomycetota bacterium]MCL5444519.1 ABC transporter ATP-binding protein [Actinomycetota bacterium]